MPAREDCHHVKPSRHAIQANLVPRHPRRVGGWRATGSIFPSNYSDRSKAPFVYFTATLDAAVWGAELAAGDDLQRIYLVEPTGEFENDPNLTDQKFRGNPTQSFRSRVPLRIIGEVVNWAGHPDEQVAAMKASLAALEAAGIKPIQD